METPPQLHRWIGSLLTSGVFGVALSMAEAQGATASEPGPKRPGATVGRPEPDVTATNTIQLNEEIANSLEKRFRSSPRVKGETLESENVLARPVEKVVVDEIKPWRDRLESALKRYETASDASERTMAEDLLIGIVTNPDTPVDIQRDSLKALAQINLDGRFYSKAQMIYSQMVDRFPLHPDTPAILYRQGVLFRRIGATELALSKFHAVMSTVLSLPEKDISTYKSIVLMSQAEIADTFFMAGNFERATEYFKRVLKLADEELNEAQVRLKLVKAYFELKDWKNVITEGRLAIEKVALSSQVAEVRFLMTEAFKKLGMQREALEQTLALLNSEQARSSKDPDNWAYWQKRTGNKLANELYERGDYLNALLVYETLGQLPGDDTWRSQALYQTGLIYERLEQPERAIEAYTRIVASSTPPSGTNFAPSIPTQGPAGSTNTPPVAGQKPSPPPQSSNAQAMTNTPAPNGGGALASASVPKIVEDAPTPSPSLKLIRDMAQWRLNNLQWDQGVQKEVRNLSLKRGAGKPAAEITTMSTNGIPGGKPALP